MKRRNRIRTWMVPAMLLASVLAASPASATTILNGSFELGTDPGSFAHHSAGSSGITDWNVLADTVAYIGSYWVASDGARSIHLNGVNGPSGISQTLETVAGWTYLVGFDYAANPSGAAIKTLRVSAAGEFQDYTFDSTGRTVSNMGWSGGTFEFVASGSETVLSFASVGPAGFFGPALDNIELVSAEGPPISTPEPGTALILMAGLLGLGAFRRFGQP